MSRRIWENLPEKFRPPTDIDTVISLWRGDYVGREATGMPSYLIDRQIDPEQVVYDAIFAKYPNIKTLVKRHTHGNHNSPFVSLTDNLSLAQEYASGAIYRIEVPAYRLVIAPAGSSETPYVEALAIGHIAPEEIVEVMPALSNRRYS